jgi:hypothetical protein
MALTSRRPLVGVRWTVTPPEAVARPALKTAARQQRSLTWIIIFLLISVLS